MSAFLSSVPKLQFFDANGDPLAGGKLYTYAAGTTTPLATYTDSTGATPNTNPIILDSRGEANVWLTAVAYKFELKTSADALIWTVDNISNALNLSQLLANSGSAANPPYTFAADPTTGMYLGAVGQIALSANGTPVLRSSDTAMIIGQIGGSNDVDVTLYGDFTQTGNADLTGNLKVTGDVEITSELGVGIAAPAVKVHVVNESAVTNAVTPVLRLDSRSTGTPAAGIGAAMEFAAETTVGNIEVGATIHAAVTSTLIASEDFDLVFSTMRFGSYPTEKARLRADGNLGVGTDAPAVRLHAQTTSTATSTVTPVFRIDSQSTTTPVAGIGVGMQFATETAVGNTEIGATIEAITTDVTSTSEDFDLSFKTMTAGAAASEKARLTSTGLLQFDSGYGSVATAYGCRAWVNFDGTGTPTRRGNGNVGSITDNGTGDYTVNFTTSMPDANYAAVATCSQNDSAGRIAVVFSYLTTSVRVGIRDAAFALFDASIVNVAIFR